MQWNTMFILNTWLLFMYLLLVCEGVRQIALASRNDIVETTFLWEADYLDCGNVLFESKPDFIYRRSVVNNISSDCFSKVYVEFIEDNTYETLFRAEYNISNSGDLSKFDFFLDSVPTIYIPPFGGYVTVTTPAINDPNITVYEGLYGFRLLISTDNLDTFYAGIHSASENQFISASQPTGINVSAYLYNKTTYMNHVLSSGVKRADFISISIDTNSDASCMYNTSNLSDIDNCTTKFIFASRADGSCMYNNLNGIDNCTKPTVTTNNPYHLLTVGEEVNFICSYEDSFPEVLGFKWYQNKHTKLKETNKTLNSTDGLYAWNDTHISMSISNATMYDMGTYHFYAYTPIYPYGHANIQLGAPPFVWVHPMEGQQGLSFDFCKIYTYPTDISVTLLKEETNTSKSVNVIKWYSYRNRTYGIRNGKFSDTGNYTCIAVNSFGATTSDMVEVIIYGVAISLSTNGNNITYGEDIIVTCQVESYPADHEFFWAFNGSQIVTSPRHQINVIGYTHKLHVIDVTFADGGYYGCIVNNTKTNQTNKVLINVVGDVPFVHTSQTYVPANISDKVILRCDFDAHPNATHLYWTKQENGTEVPISAGATDGNLLSPYLVFNSVQGIDRGDYICHVGNLIGNTSSNAVHILIDAYPPIVTSNLASQVSVNLSDSVTLTCLVDATPEVTVLYWTRTISGQVINISTLATGGTPASHNLFIESVKWTDAGVYTCHAGNELGNVSGSPIELEVETGTPMCPCTWEYLHKLLFWESQTLPNHTTEEWKAILAPVLLELTKELSLDKKDLSSHLRKLTSAPNETASAQRIGYVGAIFLTSFAGILILADVLWIKKHLQLIKSLSNSK